MFYLLAFGDIYNKCISPAFPSYSLLETLGVSNSISLRTPSSLSAGVVGRFLPWVETQSPQTLNAN
jgi:hypothetical protein